MNDKNQINVIKIASIDCLCTYWLDGRDLRHFTKKSGGDSNSFRLQVPLR